MADGEVIEEVELRQRVLFSLLGPVVTAVDLFGFSLKELTEWVRIAYFKHLREQGLSLAEIGERMDVSERTAKGLSRKLRESFFLPERAHNLPTRIEFMLWRMPMSAARLNQVLPQVGLREIEEALTQLLDEGRIAADEGRTTVYSPTQSVNAQVAPTWVKRIGGLNSLMANLYDVVAGRFFRPDDRAFARTMTFTVLPERVDTLQRLFAETLIPAIAALDEEAHGHPDAVALRLSMLWAAYDDDHDHHETQPGDSGDSPT